MKRSVEKSDNFLNLMVDCQAIETENIEYSDKELSKTQNPFIKGMLKALRLEAEKHCVIEQMIIEGVKREAVHLSPVELENLSGYLNRHLDAEEKAVSLAEEALKKSELAVPNYMLEYLISDLKKQGSILKQFEDELKTAAIPTSATSKIFSSAKAEK
ncbi:MAG: hypothetical protein C4526_04100 [Nitrospiraceae bacterium]|nr:MAG: hypothetical protein C4526_04100 [Nitrospiraceae bacterium]